MIDPFETLLELAGGQDEPLPEQLRRLYGRLGFPLPAGRPWLIGNFVETLDGVVALNEPGLSGGGEISGHNAHDRVLMGLLRAVADAVIVGAGTLRADARHIWTAERVYPELTADYAALRRALALPARPLSVFVSASGNIDFGLNTFTSGTPALVVTTTAGERRLRRQAVPATVDIDGEAGEGRLSASAVLHAIARRGQQRLLLLEGGPTLMGDFFAESKLDELFLTVAPQVAGRVAALHRPGFVEGVELAPQRPVWGRLVSVRRAGEHLFLRYSFA